VRSGAVINIYRVIEMNIWGKRVLLGGLGVEEEDWQDKVFEGS